MYVGSIHYTIGQKLRETNINVPGDDVGIGLKAPSYNQVKHLDDTFFSSELKILSSLRLGRKVWDPGVTDLRVLKYSPNGSVH